MHRIAGASDAYVTDVLKVRTAAPTLTQYELISESPSTSDYVKVYTRDVSSYAEANITEKSGLEKDTEYVGLDGDTRYYYDASTGSGYKKSTLWMDNISDCGSMGVKLLMWVSGGQIQARAYREYDYGYYSESPYWSGAISTLTLQYKVSHPPTSGSSGYIVVPGVGLHETKAIKPASVEEHNTNLTLGYKQLHVETPTVTQKTVLAQQLTTAVQNFAFDMDDYE